LHETLRHDSIRIKLPAGFRLDGIPAPAKVESRYGALEVKWIVQDGEVRFERVLEIRNTVAPISEFPNIRDFFDRLNGEMAAPVVFVKH